MGLGISRIADGTLGAGGDGTPWGVGGGDVGSSFMHAVLDCMVTEYLQSSTLPASVGDWVCRAPATAVDEGF